MDAFSYLSVLLSIIIGLAMTQVLQGYRALLLSRGRVRFYPVPLVWSATVLVMATQSWWASFGLATHQSWTFVGFAVLLLQMVLLYLVAGIVLPDVAPDQPLDLYAHYYREVVPLNALLLAMLGASIVKDRTIDGRWPTPENLLFHGLFASLAVAALVIRRPRFHEVLAGLLVLLLAVYIALLFARL